MNRGKKINISKKYLLIATLMFIYIFTSLISSVSEKVLEFRKISINAEKISYFSSNNSSSETEATSTKELDQDEISGNIGRSFKISQTNPMRDFLGNIGTGIGHLLNGVLGVIFYLFAFPVTVLVISVMALLTILLQDSDKDAGVGEAKSGWLLTPDKIFMNKVPITNIEIFINANLAEKTKMAGFVNAIASWYRVVFLISIALLFFILIYLSIRAMISSLAKDMAEIKMMFFSWIKSVMILFLMTFIIIGVISLNSAFVSIVAQSMVNESKVLEAQVFGLVAGVTSMNFIRETISLGILFIILVQTLSFLSVYVKRLITVGFYILIAPIISVAYAIDVVGDKKAQSMRNWLKKFMGLVFVQPFHLLLYAIFAGTVYKLADTSGGLNFGILILTLVFFKFFKEAEEILKEMFQFDKEVSLSKGTGFAKLILYDQTFKRLEKMGSKKKEGDSEAGEKPIYIKAKEMIGNVTSKTGSKSSSTANQATSSNLGGNTTAKKEPETTGEATARNKFVSTMRQTAGRVFNSKAGKAVKGTYKFVGKNISPSVIGGLMGFAVADKNPIDEIITGGIAGHTIYNKAFVPKVTTMKKNLELHKKYGENAQKSSDDIEKDFHNIEKITGQNFDNTTVEGKQNIANFLEQVKNKLNTGSITKELSVALDKYREYLMKFENKTKLEADILVTKKLNDLKENKIDYTNIEGAEKDLAIAYNQTKIATEIGEFNAKHAPISGNFRDVEAVLLSGNVGSTVPKGAMGPATKREEYRNFKNEISEIMSEMKQYTEKNEKLKEEIEMMKRAGLDENDVIQKYQKTQKRTKVFKTKVEKRKLRTDITDEERDEYDKLITRIESNELSSIKEKDYSQLVLDTFQGNTNNGGSN